jgi:hypothetical protein
MDIRNVSFSLLILFQCESTYERFLGYTSAQVELIFLQHVCNIESIFDLYFSAILKQ